MIGLIVPYQTNDIIGYFQGRKRRGFSARTAKMAEKDKYFAVMRWLNDGNRLSVHSLKHIVEPKLPLTEYKMGMCGEAVYTGYKGLWKFRILAVGGKDIL